MEQMKGLTSRTESKRRRKQDIKLIQVETPDLVSMLGADWSDDDATVDQSEKAMAGVLGHDTKLISTAPPAQNTSSLSTTLSGLVEKPTLEKNKQRKSPPKITSVVVLKSGSVSGQHVPAVTNSPAAVEPEKEKREKEIPAAQPQITGKYFKNIR